MKRVLTLAGVVVASAAMTVSLASPAFAWHPEGKIVKEVQNVTQGSELADANTPAAAIDAQPGDTLKFVITVRNDGEPHSKGWNDMYFTKVTDNLPAGLQLAGGQTNKTLGKVVAGDEKAYEFTVTVTSEEDNQVICNTASFTGDSEVKDNPQSGQDDACVTVTVPPAPEPKPEPKPEPEPTPEPTPEPEAPAEIPETGLAGTLGAVLGVSSLAGAGHAYIRSRRLLK